MKTDKKPSFKKHINRCHARNRALERFGLTLSNRDLKAIEQMIREGKSTFFRRTSWNRTVHEVIYNGMNLKAVYDKNRKCLVTVF
jgi:hypothetical protein